MNVSPQLLDILNQIHRNQQQIDLLSTNNSQLTNFLIQTGMIQSLKDIPGFQFDAQRGVAIAALPAPASAPAPTVDRKGWTPERRKQLSETMKKKFQSEGAWGANANEGKSESNAPKKRRWSPEQRAHFSKLMKDRWKKWGGLKRPKAKAKAATAKS